MCPDSALGGADEIPKFPPIEIMKDLKPKYFLYARKSTEDDDHQIMSIEAQLFELREYARKENLEILEEFQESKSAKKPGRELFGEMMTRIERGEANGIIAWHPDRLARNSVDGGRIIYAVDTTKIVSLRFPTFWFESTPQGKFMLPIISPTLFEAVQKMLAKKSRPRVQKVPNHFPFAQFARCGECGSMITAQYATNRFGTKYTYYRCTKKKGVCRQPYLSSSALISQAKNLLQSVSLPLSEIENMEKQIDLWEKESISERGSVAQNLKTKLSETKEKLDKLVSLYLDGDIDREMYL
ncbi:MAG: recombinase family protein, partial [Candidatus Yanofskybacteria bacterium]|nr:recombinase family protein [Candidatus Yanofskybacteria bacterium]